MIFTDKKTAQTTMDLVQMTDGKSRRPGRRVVFELLLSIALSVGCWYTFFSMFPNPVDPIISILLIAGLPIGLYLLCWNPYLGRILVFAVFLLAAIYSVLAFDAVWNGFRIIANVAVEVLNDLGMGLAPFEVHGDSVDWSTDVFLAAIPVMLLVSMGIAHSIYHKEPLLGFLLTALPVMAGLCLRVPPSIWLLILLLLSWTGLLVLSAVARPVAKKRKSPIYIQSEKNSSLPYLFLGITLVALLGYVVVFSGEDYRPPQTVEEAKAAVIAMEEHLRFDKLGGEEIHPLLEGELEQSESPAYTENPVLELKMNMRLSAPMYLRGFVGGGYKDGKWSDSVEGAYSGEYAGIIEDLAQKGFYPWMQQDRLYRMAGGKAAVSVDVTNVNGSSKYMYLPYEAAMSGDTVPDSVNYKKDYGAFAKGLTGQREYSFKTFGTESQGYHQEALEKWLRKLKKSPDWAGYAEEEKVYRKYVYDWYRYVSQEDAASLGASGIETCEGKGIAHTLSYIRSTFNEGFQYEAKQDNAPQGQDELYYFMNESHAGNDAHFATAAALMFRKAGIPARYAEGYYLSPDYLKTAAEDDGLSVSVPDSLTHSWVEIYVDEIGWFPVEVTPGFYDMEQQGVNKTQEEDAVKEDPQQSDEDDVSAGERPDQTQDEGNEPINLWILAAAALLLVIALYEVLGRIAIHRLLRSFTTVFTAANVYAMYRYAGKVMNFDRHTLPLNPYDKLEEVSAAYDSVTEITFEEFLGLVNSVRFGHRTLTEEEHRRAADYAIRLGRYVYERQKTGRKILMKAILFYV